MPRQFNTEGRKRLIEKTRLMCRLNECKGIYHTDVVPQAHTRAAKYSSICALGICPFSWLFHRELAKRLMDACYTFYMVFRDFAKAFDIINHRFLLAKLKAILIYLNEYSCVLQVLIVVLLPGTAPCLRSYPNAGSLSRISFC